MNNSTDNQNLNLLLEKANATIWQINPQGLLTSIGTTRKELQGLTSDDIINKKYFYDLHPEQGKEEFIKKIFDLLERKESFNNLENPVLNPDGNIEWLLSTGFPILDSSGELLGYQGIHLNITNQKKLEQKLEQKNKELIAFHNISENIYHHSHDIDNIMQNIIKTLQELFTPNGTLEIQIQIENIIYHSPNFKIAKECFKQDIRIDDKNIGHLTIGVVGKYFKDDQEILTNSRQIIFDICERISKVHQRITLEKQLFHSSKLASIGELAASIGHEINNPLSIIMGNTNFLTRDSKNNSESFTHSLEVINQSCTRINNIVLGLRTFARQDDDDTCTTIDVHQLIEQSLLLIKVIFLKENITIDKQFNAESLIIKINPGKLQQVLMNLLTNARHALNNNKNSQIIIKTTNINDSIKIDISDNGTGIHKDDLNKIFTSFFTTKISGTGTGLGLSISKKIINEMQGHVNVTSELGTGTTFSIELPLYRGNKTKIDLPTDTKLEALSGKALIVDDEKDIRAIIGNIIKKLGIEYDEAGDGKTALEMAKDNKYDYLITDIKMPQMNGFQLIQEIRAQSYIRKIIIISGEMSINNTYDPVEMSDAIIAKPFKILDIYHALKQLK